MTTPQVPPMARVSAVLTSALAYWVLGPHGGAVALVWRMPSGTWTAVRFVDNARIWGARNATRTAVAGLVYTAPRHPQLPRVLTVFFVKRRFVRIHQHGGFVYVAACEAAARFGYVAGTEAYARFVLNFYHACQLLPA